MKRAPQPQAGRLFAPYPLAVQSVAVVSILGAPLSGLAMGFAPWRLWALVGICLLHLLAITFVPARRLPLWAQIVYLVAQLGLAATGQALAPAPLLDYVYLAIVLQAMTLFRPWLWIPFSVGVYTVWSGVLLIVTASIVAWLRSNLALAFPATCAIIAAIVYMRQQRRSEQVQQLLQQVQQRYDQLTAGLWEQQQRAALEERSRFAATVVGEVQAALSRAEQSVTAALTQAQTNLARLQGAVAQTRDSAANAVERLRSAVAALRGESSGPPPPPTLAAALTPVDEAVIAATPNMVLTWVLPSVFVILALAFTLLTHPFAVETFAPLLACSILLLGAYVGTQRTQHPLLVQAGLAGQAVVVVLMTLLTHTLPMLLGLLLVLWQLALRFPLRQIVLYLAGAPAAAALVLVRWQPGALGIDSLLVGAVAAVAVGAPLLLARRQLERRKQAELRLHLLSAEIEGQLAEVRALAAAAERSRLAREVHDDLGSRLVLINVQLQLAEELAAEDPAAALEQLQSSREQLHLAWRAVLTVADAELPMDGSCLPAALADLAAHHGPLVRLSMDGELDELSPARATAVYRAVQEGLTNARKHGRPGSIEVQVNMRSGYATVTVINDNSGPVGPEGARTGGGGYGLIGLRERAEALGGGLEAGPLPEGGWRLRVVLPAEGV